MSSVAAVAGSAKVPDGADNQYLTAGTYLLQATLHKEHTADGKLAFIAEHAVLQSEVAPANDPGGKPTLAPGMSGTLYVDCQKFKGALAWMVKHYLAALTNTPEDEVDADSIAASMTTDQPFVGMVVRCRAWTHVTDNDAKVTRYKFEPATAEDVAAVPELRKAAGLEPMAVTVL